MRLPPLHELLVASEHGVDHLVQDVLGRFAQELRVRIQGLVVLAIESGSVLHELLAARARLDQWHDTLRFRKMWTTVGDHLEALRATSGLPIAGPARCRVDDACADLFVRTNETRSRGVNDPLPKGLGTGFGGWQRGSFTPRLPLHCRPRLAAHPRAAQNAARSRRQQLARFQQYAGHRLPAATCGQRALRDLAARTRRGNAPPESVFPPPFRRSAGYAEPTRGVRWA